MPTPIVYPIRVTVGSPVDGGETAIHQFYAARAEIHYSWGLQPATAKIDWVTAETNIHMVPLNALTIAVGGRVFHGLLEEWTKVDDIGGTTWMQLFQDSRALLQFDAVVCRFNRRKWVQDGTTQVKRYEHVLPVDGTTGRITETDGPFTGAEILDYLFNAPGVKWPWVRSYHSALAVPVYDVDFYGGAKLGTAVQQISESCGTTFTLQGGRYSLVWCVKGVGSLPILSPGAESVRLGAKLSGHPSRITLLGERSLYQVLDVPLVKDWSAGWEAYFDIFLLAWDLHANERTEAAFGGIAAGTRYNAIPGDTEFLVGWQLAVARSQTITVGEYAALRDARSAGSGNAFRDYGKYCGRARMTMPAALYIKTLLFRAFAVTPTFQIYNANGYFVPLSSLEIVETALAEVWHNPATGAMSWDYDVVSATNGYCVAQGYELGSDGFATVRPEHFQLEEWVAHQDLWQRVEFHLDDSGQGYQFLLFDEPMIRSSDLLKVPIVNAVLQDFPTLNATATITTPAVRAALVFAAERFRYTSGVPPRDEVVNDPGLQGQYMARYSGLTGWTEEELAYADGNTAAEKASLLMASLISRQSVYLSGGMVPPYETGLGLSPMLDRITVVADAEKGYEERIDWTAERSRREFEPERDYDRRQQVTRLLPGERELRVDANQRKLLAAGLRQNPKFVKTMTSAAAGIFGYESPGVVYPKES